MKELILVCAVAAVFALRFLILKKLDIFFGDSSRTVISSDRPSMLSIAFEHTEEVSLLNDLLERFSPVSYTHLDVYKRQPYTQPKRRAGKSKNNFYSLYDYAMIGITSYSKVVMRLATFAGFIIGGLSFAAGIVYLILKLMYWDRFSAGIAPIVIGMFFLGALQLFFIGFLGEYVLSINTRVLDRPLVVEEERLNFEDEDKKCQQNRESETQENREAEFRKKDLTEKESENSGTMQADSIRYSADASAVSYTHLS